MGFSLCYTVKHIGCVMIWRVLMTNVVTHQLHLIPGRLKDNRGWWTSNYCSFMLFMITLVLCCICNPFSIYKHCLINRKDKSYDCHISKWLDKLLWERLSVKGKSPRRKLFELNCQSNVYMKWLGPELIKLSLKCMYNKLRTL